MDTKNDVRVGQTATSQYAIHEFKDYASAGPFTLEWEGQSNLAPSSSKVVLQIYNFNGNIWEDVDEENGVAADTDFVLTGTISVDLDHYKSANNVISCRVYQLAI